MTLENLELDLQGATHSLIDLLCDDCWNQLSCNCLYILTDTRETDNSANFYEQRKQRKRFNLVKTPEPLSVVTARLRSLYPNLQDIRLRLFHALTDCTIIEMEYTLSERPVRPDVSPGLHCSVAIPPYAKAGRREFDANWELGSLEHSWKMFWWMLWKHGRLQIP